MKHLYQIKPVILSKNISHGMTSVFTRPNTSGFFPWSGLKVNVYRHNIQDMEHAIPLQMWRNTCDNVALCLQAFTDVEGANVEHHYPAYLI